MSGKTLIGGTAYEITGGKTLVGGTAYSISGGRTLIDGTVKEISFGKIKQRFIDVMSTMTPSTGNSHNSNTTGTVTATSSSGRYMFVFCNGHMSIWRAQSSTNAAILLFQTSTTEALLNTTISKIYALSNDGGATTAQVYEGSIQQWTRGSTYTEAEVDECFMALKYISSAGNNLASGSVISINCPASSLLIGSSGLSFAAYYPADTRQITGRQAMSISYTNGVASLANGTTIRGSLIRLG